MTIDSMTTQQAIITGASRGLGLALTTALSRRGWTVVADARQANELHEACGDLPGVVPVVGDVRDPAHRAALADVVRREGRLDLLVNNASRLGPSPLLPLSDLPVDELSAVLEVNVVAPLALIQELSPFLSAGAAVVNVTSDAAVEAYPGWGGYGASKAALEQVGRVLAVERPDLAVYTFDPGDMRTRMHQEAFPGEDISDRPHPDGVAVPALLRLLEARPGSGRYRAQDVLAAVTA